MGYLPRIACVVTDRVILARGRIAVRMGRERSRQPAAEIAVGHRFQIAGKLRRVRPRFHQRQNARSESDYVGVDVVAHAPARSRRGSQASGIFQRARPNVAIAVPLGPAARQAHAVHHPIAHKPVVAARVGKLGIRADANIAAIQFGRDRAGNGQIVQSQLGIHRCMKPGGERIFGIQAGPADIGDLSNPRRHRAANGFLQNACHAILRSLANVSSVNISVM